MPEISDYELRRLEAKAAVYDNGRKWTLFVCKVAAGVTVATIGIVFLFGWISPKIALYRANTTKQAVIAEQRAISEAAEFAAKSLVVQAQSKADAEVIRATGLAKSQTIIAETLTDDYIRYLFIQSLEGHNNQIVYIPTEAGLPILEAGRAVPVATTP